MKFKQKRHQFLLIKLTCLPLARLNTSSTTDKSRNRPGQGFDWSQEAPTYAANSNSANENWIINRGNSSCCSNLGCKAFFLQDEQQHTKINVITCTVQQLASLNTDSSHAFSPFTLSINLLGRISNISCRSFHLMYKHTPVCLSCKARQLHQNYSNRADRQNTLSNLPVL